MKKIITVCLLILYVSSESSAQYYNSDKKKEMREFIDVKPTKDTRASIASYMVGFTDQLFRNKMHKQRFTFMDCWTGIIIQGDTFRFAAHIDMPSKGSTNGKNYTYISISTKDWLVIFSTPPCGGPERMTISIDKTLNRKKTYKQIIKTLERITPETCSFTVIKDKLHNTETLMEKSNTENN